MGRLTQQGGKACEARFSLLVSLNSVATCLFAGGIVFLHLLCMAARSVFRSVPLKPRAVAVPTAVMLGQQLMTAMMTLILVFDFLNSWGDCPNPSLEALQRSVCH